MLDNWIQNKDSPLWINFQVLLDKFTEVPLPPPLAAGTEGGCGGDKAVCHSGQSWGGTLGGYVEQPALSIRWGSPEMYEM